MATASRDIQLVLAILALWRENRSYQTYSPLDVVALSVQASATPSRLAYKSVSVFHMTEQICILLKQLK